MTVLVLQSEVGDYKGGAGTCCWWACKLALSFVHLLERPNAGKIMQLCLFVHVVGLVVQPLPFASADLEAPRPTEHKG